MFVAVAILYYEANKYTGNELISNLCSDFSTPKEILDVNNYALFATMFIKVDPRVRKWHHAE